MRKKLDKLVYSLHDRELRDWICLGMQMLCSRSEEDNLEKKTRFNRGRR